MIARPEETGDIDMLAAEYVVGTLDAAERADVAVRRGREPALDAAILAWQQRLAPIDAATPAIAPPADLFGKIAARTGVPPLAAMAATSAGAEVIQLMQRVRRWRRMAVAASALAASLAVAIGLRETVLAPQPQNFVAVFQKDDALPSFLLSLDLTLLTRDARRYRTYFPKLKLIAP